MRDCVWVSSKLTFILVLPCFLLGFASVLADAPWRFVQLKADHLASRVVLATLAAPPLPLFIELASGAHQVTSLSIYPD